VYHTTDADARQIESPDWKLALRVCPVSCLQQLQYYSKAETPSQMDLCSLM